jgi:hypothetical protein
MYQQAVQKGRSARPQRVKDRGGTYQASLEPLVSITCERIITLPPGILDRYVEDLNDARTPLAAFFNSLLVIGGVRGHEGPSDPARDQGGRYGSG